MFVFLLQCAMFLGWITGMHPPGKTLACFTAGKVVMHKLMAHCDAYKAIKKLPIGKDLKVTWLNWAAVSTDDIFGPRSRVCIGADYGGS